MIATRKSSYLRNAFCEAVAVMFGMFGASSDGSGQSKSESLPEKGLLPSWPRAFVIQKSSKISAFKTWKKCSTLRCL